MPDIFEKAAKETRSLFEAGLQAVQERLNANDVALTEWNAARQRAISQEISSILRNMTTQANTISQPFVQASFVAGLEQDQISPDWSRIAVDQVNAIANEMNRSLTDGIAQIGRWVDDGLRQAQLQSLTENQIQGLGQRGQRKRFLEIMNERNLSMPRGFKGDVGAYAEMVTRTNLAEANRVARINRSLERGYTLVEIPEHGATDTCKPWEGAIISLLPNTLGIPTYDQVRALKGTHIFKPNCRHESLTPVHKRLFSDKEVDTGILKAIDAYRQFGGSISGYKPKTKVKAKIEIDRLVKKAKAKKPSTKSFKKFDSEKEMDQWGVEKFKPARLYYGEDTYQSMQDYKDVSYSQINGYLRGKNLKGEAKEFVESTIANLDKAIDKTVIPDDITVYRGLRNMEFKEGQVFEEKSYMSTTLNEKITHVFNTELANKGDVPSILEIKVPKGHKGLWMDDFDLVDYTGNKEFEVLLNRGTKLKITGVDNSGKVTKYIAEVIE